ncbi:MAG: UrcA family protein [Steroidobacteraceae bacterium]
MNKFIRIVALGAILATPLAVTVPAFAGATVDRSEVVKYNDLNLTTSAGAETLYSRLKVATWRVCRDVVTSAGLPGMMERTNCMTDLLDSAVKDVNKPTLTALHEGKSGSALTAAR